MQNLKKKISGSKRSLNAFIPLSKIHTWGITDEVFLES